MIDQKISGLGFFWKQAWECGSVFSVRGAAETRFTKKRIPELTFLWMQYHWERFQLAEQPFPIHLALRKGTGAWS